MITDKMVEAAYLALSSEDFAGILRVSYPVAEPQIKRALEAAEAAACQPIETAPRNERIIIQTAVDTHVAQWAKNPFTDDVAYVVSRSGEDQHVIEPGKIERWRHLPAGPNEG